MSTTTQNEQENKSDEGNSSEIDHKNVVINMDESNQLKEDYKNKNSETDSSVDHEQVAVSIERVIVQKQPSATHESHEAYQIEDPYKNKTNTVPHLLRKIPEEELTQAPCKSFNQIICFSYLGFLFCCFIGCWVTKKAWNAKVAHQKGLYDLAKKRGKKAVYCTYLAIALGCCWILIVTLSVTLSKD